MHLALLVLYIWLSVFSPVPVCMHFCNQHKHFAEPPTIYLAGQNSYEGSNRSYIFWCNIWSKLTQQQSCKIFQNKLPQSSGYFKSCRPHQLRGQSKNSTVSLLSPCKIQIRLGVHCIWASFRQHSNETGPHPLPQVMNCSWSFSYFPSNKPLCECKRNVFKKQTKENVHELCIKTKNLSWEPSLQLCFWTTKLKTLQKIQPWPGCGWWHHSESVGISLNLRSVCLWQNIKKILQTLKYINKPF